ncbi:hypothetical protein ACEQ8H_004851 [Pleosporales sp. CAS-2024a]
MALVLMREAADIVAQLTEGFSFAYLKELFVMALLSLVRGTKMSDDLDMVENDEAGASLAKEDAADPAETGMYATKCNDCGKMLPAAKASEAAKKADDTKEADKEATKNKMVTPTVDIPAHLQSNLLLKVVKYQIGVLCELDNTKDYKGKRQDGGEIRNLRWDL